MTHKTIKEPYLTIFIYVTTMTFFTLFFLVLIRLPVLKNQTVVFYRGLILLSAVFFASVVAIFFINRLFSKSKIESMMAAIFVAVSINLSLFVVLPVTFERSVTMYLLNLLNENEKNSCRGLTKNELRKHLVNEYVTGKDAVGKRIVEQTAINMIEEENRCYKLTKRGKNFLQTSELIKKIYNIK